MKKKILSMLLSAAMVATCFAGCGSSTENEAGGDASASADLPEAVYYYSFDEADDSDSIQPTAQDTSATDILTAADKDKTYIPGVKGEALYTDGVTGYKLTDVNGVGDTYTVSFWIYATRFSNYMPTVQFGPDVHGDATGGQHYLNITRAEWGADSAATFPCIWAYDENDDGLWPNWAPDDANEHLKEWTNITLVVDANNVSTDGTMLVANLYVNGEEVTKTDSDGNIVPINVVNGCMEASDNFDFLLGVNYWDSVFKGAFDELYIFDQALTADQAKALYEMGDTTVEYEEPDRVVDVVATEDALYTLGTTDLTAGFWTNWTPTTEIKDGETKEITLKNYSDGVNLWDNFVTVFVNEESDGTENPNADGAGSANYKEYAVTRADMYSWGDGIVDPADDEANATCEYTWSWGNWDTWRTSVMVDTDVTVKINRNGSDLTLDYNFVDYNGTSNTATAVLHTSITSSDPVYFFLTNEASYVEVYSIKDAIVVEADANAVDSIGTTELNMGFWTDFSEGIELADGDKRTVKFKNYSDGVNNWDNYVLGFHSTDNDAHVDPNTVDGTTEYAALRADAYGWGNDTNPAELAYETSWGDDWASWLSAMMAADVTLEVSRSGNVITVDATVVGADGVTYTSTSTITSETLDGDCYFFITGEACYIDIMSIE